MKLVDAEKVIRELLDDLEEATQNDGCDEGYFVGIVSAIQALNAAEEVKPHEGICT